MTLDKALYLFDGRNGEERLTADANSDGYESATLTYYSYDPSSENSGIQLQVLFELNPDDETWTGDWEDDPNEMELIGITRVAQYSEFEEYSEKRIDAMSIETEDDFRRVILEAIQVKKN